MDTKIFVRLLVAILALVIILLVVISVRIWHSPAIDATYMGFDPNLVYVDKRGDAALEGTVDISTQSILITAIPYSQPTIHFVTTPLSFNASFDIRILNIGDEKEPLRIGVWSPRERSGFFVSFGSSNNNFIEAEALKDGTTAKTLIGGNLLKRVTLGRYSESQLYHLEISVDRQAGLISVTISSQEKSPTGTRILVLSGGPSNPHYTDIVSDFVPVEGGKEYSFGGLVKVIYGSDAYKIAVGWYDNEKRFLSFANDWRSVKELNDWTEREFRVRAPLNASYARLYVGAGDATLLAFTDLFLRETNMPLVNLLPNGDFHQGSEGWYGASDPSFKVEILEPYRYTWRASLNATEHPELFKSLRLSLTASVSARSGITTVLLENYTLTLPHQRWQVNKIGDPVATELLMFLFILGAALIIVRFVLFVSAKPRVQKFLDQEVRIPLKVIVVGAVYGLVNLMLFGLGAHPFDMTSAKIWSYVAAQYGPSELYYLPSIVSLAKVWGGAPYHEAVFPYEPIMSYYFTIIGWIYKFFLTGPAGFAMDTIQLELLIKAFNVIFGLGDGLLIYLILRQLGVGRRERTLASALFLFNPAILFNMSVWGQNHVFSLFFVLLSIWLAQTHRLTWSWLALILGALTRPQVLVPASLVGLSFVKRYGFLRNLYAVSWAIVASFLLIGPLIFAIGPSLPVDILMNILYVQEAGGNEPALTTVSLDAISVWPLVTQIVHGQSGLARIFYPSATPLIGTLTYQQVSLILSAVIISIAIVFVICNTSTDFLAVLAFATIGFLLFKTGLASTHFVLGLPFLFLCRRSLCALSYYSTISIWTVGTLVPMYASFGFAILNVGYLAPSLHPTNNIMTRLFMGLYSSDIAITVFAVGNTLVLILLGITIITHKARGGR